MTGERGSGFWKILSPQMVQARSKIKALVSLQGEPIRWLSSLKYVPLAYSIMITSCFVAIIRTYSGYVTSNNCLVFYVYAYTLRDINSAASARQTIVVRDERYHTEQKSVFMAMESSAVDYHRLSGETRDTVLAYTEQEWPVTKTSVSSSAL